MPTSQHQRGSARASPLASCGLGFGLRGNQFGDKGAESLAEALEVNAKVTELTLWENEIRNEGAKSLAKALKVNTTVKELYLQCVDSLNQIGDQGAMSLAEALKVNTTVTGLGLSCVDSLLFPRRRPSWGPFLGFLE